MKTPKDIFQENTLSISNVIVQNQDKTLSEIASILNKLGYKTKKGLDWHLNAVNYYMTAILKLPPRREAGTVAKESYENYDAIFKIISECKNLAYPRIAKILNEHNLKTKRGNSWNDKTVRVFLSDELNINKSTDMARFEKNILNQLDKIESKVTPEPEIEIVPNYEIKDLVFEQNERFFTDSLNIASVFEKEHSDILTIIKNLINTGKLGGGEFTISSYETKQNKILPLYLLNKDLFSLVVFGFQGDKALDFKLAYIKQFNKMEKALLERYKQQTPIRKDISTLELMEMTSKSIREQEEKVFNQIKKESECIKHETNQVLEKQKIEFDKQFKALDERISNIPVYEVKKVYTQEPIKFNSKGLKDTNNTFKTKGDDVINIRKSISNSIKEYDSMRIKQKQKVYTEVYNYMIGIDKTLPEDFYKQYESFISQYGYIAMLDFVFKLGKQKEMQRAIETLKTKLGE